MSTTGSWGAGVTLAPELCQTLPQSFPLDHTHSPIPPDKGKGSSCMWGAHPPEEEWELGAVMG